jgi:hypothetical protein
MKQVRSVQPMSQCMRHSQLISCFYDRGTADPSLPHAKAYRIGCLSLMHSRVDLKLQAPLRE